jgi:hypothetical protein
MPSYEYVHSLALCLKYPHTGTGSVICVDVQVVHCDKEFGKHSTHRIMFHLGIAEIIGLCMLYSTAVFCVCADTFHPWINKVKTATRIQWRLLPATLKKFQTSWALPISRPYGFTGGQVPTLR